MAVGLSYWWGRFGQRLALPFAFTEPHDTSMTGIAASTTNRLTNTASSKPLGSAGSAFRMSQRRPTSLPNGLSPLLTTVSAAAFIFLLVAVVSVYGQEGRQTPEERCSQYEGAMFQQCVRDVSAEEAKLKAFHQQFETERRQAAVEEQRALRARETCKRTGFSMGTVKIGMSARMVRDCGWGNPSSVNSTTTTRGTREQWVYGPGSYLYFERGRLTAIQN
jgi:hypothetical protein